MEKVINQSEKLTLASNILFVKDYINMQQKAVHSQKGWLSVRSLIVNEQGDTFALFINRIDENFDFNFPPSIKSLLEIKKLLTD